MESKILLGRILQKFIDKGYAQVSGYNRFGFIKFSNNAVLVTRENGGDTPVSFSKIVKGIEAYQSNSSLYDSNPTELRDSCITHVTSPIFALLHLLEKEDYI
jgi:hypothetical protein